MKRLLMFIILIMSFTRVDAIAQQTIFFDSFETGAFNSTFWRPIPGPNNGVVQVGLDNTTPAEFFSVIMGKNNDGGGNNTNELQLHLDLSGREQVALTFFVKSFFDESGPFDAFYLSDNGGASFAPRAYQFRTGDWVQNAWGMLPPIDIDGLARDLGLKLTSTFVISFRQFGTGDFNTGGDEDGLIFDAIRVEKPNTTYISRFPFSDGFESTRLDSMWKWANPTYPALTTEAGTLRIEGVAGVSTTRPHNAFYSVFLGKRADGQPTTSALDLHLDLSAPQIKRVTLRFWIADFFDDTQDYDALYFSNDGGESFFKLYQLTPSNWQDNVYREIVVNVSDSVAAHKLKLTNRCIIRFQQFGTADFDTGGEEDGIFIDDVSVVVDFNSAVENKGRSIPDVFALEQNYPNPFNPSTQISFALPSAQKVTLKVFDLSGKEIATLLDNEPKAAGTYELTFDAKNLPSGVYLYKLRAGEYFATRKMILLR